MRHPKLFLTFALTASAATLALAASHRPAAATDSPNACAGDNGGIKLPPGFCATIFADHIGHTRQMAVAPDGTVYANTWSGRYYQNDKPHDGGFLVALKATKGDGVADTIERFGGTAADGDAGGTGIALYNNKVYAETNDKIVAYDLAKGDLAPKGKPVTIVSGLPITGDHPMHPFIIDPDGKLFVDLGTPSNTCQEQNRTLGSMGKNPCQELETRGGIWLYDANKTDQQFSPAQRYATGLRNGEGFSFDSKGRLFVTQHGRDQLNGNFPQLYTQQQSENLPAEELVQVSKGADYGWPDCYFDGAQDKLVLAPEYGGDGGKKVGVCADKTRPIAAFPAHLAPNDMKIYQGSQFPKAYDDAAFIAFHGSWNRAPGPQHGYDVVVQPMEAGQTTGKAVTFAGGFAGPHENPAQAVHRPSGLAIGPKGALYISDDIQGTIWRVTYDGDKAAPITAAPGTQLAKASDMGAVPPEGMHPDAGAADDAAALKAPDGTTKPEIALGSAIFHGQAKDGTCATCHGDNGTGLPIGPPLVKKDWTWGDGSLASLQATITAGVPHPKAHPGMMPPMGGAPLTPDDVKAVAAYVYALNHQS